MTRHRLDVQSAQGLAQDPLALEHARPLGRSLADAESSSWLPPIEARLVARVGHDSA